MSNNNSNGSNGNNSLKEQQRVGPRRDLKEISDFDKSRSSRIRSGASNMGKK
jgi:hypothetical protein